MDAVASVKKLVIGRRLRQQLLSKGKHLSEAKREQIVRKLTAEGFEKISPADFSLEDKRALLETFLCSEKTITDVYKSMFSKPSVFEKMAASIEDPRMSQTTTKFNSTARTSVHTVQPTNVKGVFITQSALKPVMQYPMSTIGPCRSSLQQKRRMSQDFVDPAPLQKPEQV